MVFPVVMFGCESWTIKKAELQRIYAFKLWFWRRLLGVPWIVRSNQSILKEINPKYSLEGLMPKLKLQYLGHLLWRADLLEKTLMLGKIDGSRRRGQQGSDGWMTSLTQWTWVSANSGRCWRTGKSGVLQSMWSQRIRQDWVTEQQRDFPGSPEVKTLHFQCKGHRFDLWSRNWDPTCCVERLKKTPYL